MDFSIVPFHEKWLDQMARLFTDGYQDSGYEWDEKTAKGYLQCYSWPKYAKYCFAAVDKKGTCLGAIFCRVDPWYKGNFLFIDQLQVEPEYRKKGIAKALMQEAFKTAKKDGCIGTHLLVDSTNFTLKVYKSLGYKASGWIEMDMRWDGSPEEP